MTKIRYTENVYEFKRFGEILTGTAEELSEVTEVSIENLQRYTLLIGIRHRKLRATSRYSGKVIYGTLHELESLTEHQTQTIRFALNKKDGKTSDWHYSLTDQYIVDYIHEEKPGYKQPAKGYQSIKPVYVSKPTPMGRYAKYLLEQSFKGWA